MISLYRRGEKLVGGIGYEIYPPPYISSSTASYFLTVIAAALLLFALLTNSDNASAQQPSVGTPTPTPTSLISDNAQDVAPHTSPTPSPAAKDATSMNKIEEVVKALYAFMADLESRLSGIERRLAALEITPTPFQGFGGSSPGVSFTEPSPTLTLPIPGSDASPPFTEPSPTPTSAPSGSSDRSDLCAVRPLTPPFTQPQKGLWRPPCAIETIPSTGMAPAGTRYASFFTFTLGLPAEALVTLTSNDVSDTYLFLLQGPGFEGAVLYENDDISPFNRNSRIETQRLEPGSYTILATTYAVQTQGSFSLALDLNILRRR